MVCSRRSARARPIYPLCTALLLAAIASSASAQSANSNQAAGSQSTPPLIQSGQVGPQPADRVELIEEFKSAPELIIDGGGFTSEVTDLAISPDGQWLAASGEKVVRVWDLESGDLLHTLRGDRNRASYGDCYSVAFSPDGQYLVVGVNDYRPHGAIRVYRTENLAEIDQLLPGHQVPVRHVTFSHAGDQLASVDADGFIAVWDWSQRQVIRRLPPRDAAAPIYDALLFPDTQPILFGIDFGGPVLYSTPALVPPEPAALPDRLRAWMIDMFGRKFDYPFGTATDPRVVDLHLEHQMWGAAGVGRESKGNKFWVGVWPTHDLQVPLQSAPSTVYDQHRWNVTALSLAPQYGLAASGDRFGEVHVWDIATGQQLQKFTGQGKPIYEAVLDRNSQRIGFGTTPYKPDRWGSNNYGDVEQVIDLATRTVCPLDHAQPFEPVGEITQLGQNSLKIQPGNAPSGLRLSRLVNGQVSSEYELTSGRMPTVFSIVDRPLLGVAEPVLLGDDLGLLAMWDSSTDELKRAFIGHDGLVSSVSVATDRQLLLSSSADRTIRLWSLEAYHPTGLFDFKFENTTVTRVVPGSSSAIAGVQVGDRIVTIEGKSMKEMYELMLVGQFDFQPGQSVEVVMQRDEQVYRFNMQLKAGYDFAEPILNFYLGDDHSWIAWNPQGYYDCSPGADQLIGWHINRGPDKSARFFEAQQFRKQLYRPDIINYLLSGKSLDGAIALANQDTLREGEFDFRSPSDLATHHPPVIEFLSPRQQSPIAATTDSPQVTIQARVRSVNGLPIREVTLLVNGLASEVLIPASATALEFEIEQSVLLQAGRNEVSLIAANIEATSAAEAVRIDVRLPIEHVPQRLNVLAVGISNYLTGDKQFNLLPTAASDAQLFADTAVKQGTGRLYRDVRIRVLQDAGADRTKFLEGLQWLVDSTAAGDTAAIFISAYCFLDSNSNFYVGTYDVDLQRPRATAISWREFITTLHQDLPSCRRLVFLDLQPTAQAIVPGLRNPLLDLAAPELATTFFSSTSLQQTRTVQSNQATGTLMDALVQTLSDPTADVEPTPADTLLSNYEVTQAWQNQFQKLTPDQLIPVAYVPELSRRINVFQLNSR
jgi:WD40 repeat protein